MPCLGSHAPSLSSIGGACPAPPFFCSGWPYPFPACPCPQPLYADPVEPLHQSDHPRRAVFVSFRSVVSCSFPMIRSLTRMGARAERSIWTFDFTLATAALGVAQLAGVASAAGPRTGLFVLARTSVSLAGPDTPRELALCTFGARRGTWGVSPGREALLRAILGPFPWLRPLMRLSGLAGASPLH